MEATIPGKSLLVFGKMLQSLAKIGDDLFFDAVDDQVRYYHAHFRAVKASWHTKQLVSHFPPSTRLAPSLCLHSPLFATTILYITLACSSCSKPDAERVFLL